MSVKNYIFDHKDWFKILKLHVDIKMNVKYEKNIDDTTLFVEYVEYVEERTILQIQALLLILSPHHKHD